MNKRIEKLTAQQEAYLPEFREAWRSVGLNTERVNHDDARRSVVNLYKAANLAEPTVLVFSSPAMCLLARKLFLSLPAMKDKKQLRDQLRHQLGDQLRHQLWDQLGGQLWDQLWDQLGGQLGDQLWDQ